MKKFFFDFLVIVILASFFTSCTSIQTQTAPATGISPSTTSTEPAILIATVELTQTMAETPTQTALPLPTFPLELTQTPGIYGTATAFAATATQDYLNNLSAIGPMADLLQISQYFNPVGTPLANWHGVPVMTQATAGQEFKADIYSYRASATYNTAAQFYNQQAGTLNWSCFSATSTAGTGSYADHSVNMLCQGFTIVMTSFDNDTSHVLVVINKVP
jgi:hypothetical protein